MMSDGQIGCVIVGITVAAFAALAAIAMFFDAQACHARFAGSKMRSDWGVISGCRVLTPDQGWIPAENYRVL